MSLIKAIVVVLVIAALGIGAAACLGIYNVAAGTSQSAVTRWTLQQVRNHSMAVWAAKVTVPADLDDPARLPEGAEHYGRMCVQCHLAPGVASTDVRASLDPKPPMAVGMAEKFSPQRLFWVIKHGIAMTAMPAWGATHSDQKIWDIVAFVRQLPRMSPAQYRKMTGEADEPSVVYDSASSPAEQGQSVSP